MVSTRVTPGASQEKVNVVGGSNYGRYNKISAERTYNMFITTSGEPDSDDYEIWMVNFPGYQRVVNFVPPGTIPSGTTPNNWPSGSGRGIFKSTRGGFAIAVINSQVFRISESFVVTQIGTLNTSMGEVFMAENLSSQICIVDGQDAWIYYYGSGGPSFTQQADAYFGTDLIPNYVEYHNSFFLFGNNNQSGNGAFWYIYKFSTSSTIVFVTNLALQTKSDFALAVKRLPGQGNNVLVLGETVSEIWTNVGGLQEYIRNPTKNINYGCISVSTIGESGDIVAWLAANEEESPVIMAYDGTTLSQISTDGIDYRLSQIVRPDLSTALFYRTEGHLFYQLTFYGSSDNLTLLYDFNSKMFFNLTDQFMNYHPARQLIYFDNKLYFLSLNNAALYLLSSNITAINENLPRIQAPLEYNEELVYQIQYERITSSVRQANSGRFRANSLVLTLEQGFDPDYTGLELSAFDSLITESSFTPPEDQIITEDEQDILLDNPFALNADAELPYRPRIDLAISKDGGNTWSNYVPNGLHRQGDKQNILQWPNMGVANDLCFKFRFYGTARWVINNALVDIVI